MTTSWRKEGVTMTTWQSMMLSVCFGSTVGFMIGMLITVIRFTIEDRKEKKRRKKEQEQERETVTKE
jgi:hypothetical protein